MKKPPIARRALLDRTKPPTIAALRKAAKARAVDHPKNSHALARLESHIEALEAGLPTISPAKARARLR